MFSGRLAVITGGSSGLGMALAARLIEQGARVVLISRNINNLDEAEAALRANAPSAQVVAMACDVSDPRALTATFHEIIERFGDPSVVVCSAGLLHEDTFLETSPEVSQRLMNVNFYGVVNTLRAALPSLRKAADGRIVVVSSVGGLMGVYGYSAYSASKFALTGLCDCLRQELLGTGIRLHLVCPGEFEGPMVDGISKGRSALNRAVVQTIPVTTVSDVADAVMLGMAKNRYKIVPGWRTRLMVTLMRWFPETSFKTAARLLERARSSAGG